MVSMEALLAQLKIKLLEDRKMEIFDVPGSYLNYDIPEDKFFIVKTRRSVHRHNVRSQPRI